MPKNNLALEKITVSLSTYKIKGAYKSPKGISISNHAFNLENNFLHYFANWKIFPPDFNPLGKKYEEGHAQMIEPKKRNAFEIINNIQN